MKNCYSCKYSKFENCFCSKQGILIIHPEKDCKYWNRGWLCKIIDFLNPEMPKEQRSDNCKE